MKKLLMKWFPNYFNIHNHVTTYLDVSKVGSEMVDNLRVFEVNTEDNTLTGGLGITDERAMELGKAVEIEFLRCDNICQVMQNLTKDTVKHANESFYCAHIIANKMKSRSGSDFIQGLMEAIKKGGNNPSGQ